MPKHKEICHFFVRDTFDIRYRIAAASTVVEMAASKTKEIHYEVQQDNGVNYRVNRDRILPPFNFGQSARLCVGDLSINFPVESYVVVKNHVDKMTVKVLDELRDLYPA